MSDEPCNVIVLKPRCKERVVRIGRDADGNLVPIDVIAFEPRAKQADLQPHGPPLGGVALFMDPVSCNIELELIDADGNVVATLPYNLAYAPPGFDLDLLRELWDRYRGRPVNSAS